MINKYLQVYIWWRLEYQILKIVGWIELNLNSIYKKMKIGAKDIENMLIIENDVGKKKSRKITKI